VKSKKHNQYKQNQRNDFDDSADCVDDSRLPTLSVFFQWPSRI
jgi:hypothetical protein